MARMASFSQLSPSLWPTLIHQAQKAKDVEGDALAPDQLHSHGSSQESPHCTSFV